MKIPKKSCILNSEVRSEDSRGSIISISDQVINNVSIIECLPKTIRSNHYHLTDWHLIYILEGQIDYFYKNLNEEKINYFFAKKGDNIFTPSNEIHATYFEIHTTLVVCSKNPRDQINYEKDTLRYNLIDDKNINDLLKKFKSI